MTDDDIFEEDVPGQDPPDPAAQPAPAPDIRQIIREEIAASLREDSGVRAPVEEEEELSYDPNEIKNRAVRDAGKLIAETQQAAYKARETLKKEFPELTDQSIDSVISNIMLQGPQEALRHFNQGSHKIHATHEVGKQFKEGKLNTKSPKPLAPTGIGNSNAPKTDADQQLIRDYEAVYKRKPTGRELDMLLGRS